jgi:hypothetical protein
LAVLLSADPRIPGAAQHAPCRAADPGSHQTPAERTVIVKTPD